MPAGRPEGTVKVELTETQFSEMEVLAGLGLNLNDIASVFGISKTTLWRYANENPRINETLEKGRAKANAKVAQSLYNNAVKNDNIAAQIWWTKSRMGWREQAPEVEQDAFKLAYADEPLDGE